jgi:hypothetical protein
MICTICGDHAIGFNYDVLSCASCKAFFRRNANQNSVSFVLFLSSFMLIFNLFLGENPMFNRSRSMFSCT